MNKAALAIILVCTGCGVRTGPSPHELQARQEQQMKQALQTMQSQMEGAQDVMAGRDTEAARAYKKQSEAMALQGKQMEAQLRKDPKYVRAQEESEREHREFLVFEQMGRMMRSSIERMNSPEVRSGLSKSEEFEADSDGAILAWRAGYEAWGLVAVMQRFEAASRNRYAADTALAGHPEPLQRFKILDAALRSRNEKDTLGELGTERFQGATQSVRQRAG